MNVNRKKQQVHKNKNIDQVFYAAAAAAFFSSSNEEGCSRFMEQSVHFFVGA